MFLTIVLGSQVDHNFIQVVSQISKVLHFEITQKKFHQNHVSWSVKRLCFSTRHGFERKVLSWGHLIFEFQNLKIIHSASFLNLQNKRTQCASSCLIFNFEALWKVERQLLQKSTILLFDPGRMKIILSPICKNLEAVKKRPRS